MQGYVKQHRVRYSLGLELASGVDGECLAILDTNTSANGNTGTRRDQSSR